MWGGECFYGSATPLSQGVGSQRSQKFRDLHHTPTRLSVLWILLCNCCDFCTTSFFKSFVYHNFYRATLCATPVFAVARCLSVRLSVTLVQRIHTAEDIVKRLCQPSSPITLAFLILQRRYPIPRDPLQRVHKIQGGGENLRLSIDIAVYLGNGTR